MATHKFFDLLAAHSNLCQPKPTCYSIDVLFTRDLLSKSVFGTLKRVAVYTQFRRFCSRRLLSAQYSLQKIYDTFAHFLLLTIIINNTRRRRSRSTLEETTTLHIGFISILYYTHRIRCGQTINFRFFFSEIQKKYIIYFLVFA